MTIPRRPRPPVDLAALAATLGEAEAKLRLLSKSLDPAAVAELEERIDRARRNLDSLAILEESQVFLEKGPYWWHLFENDPRVDQRASRSAGKLPR